MTADSGTRLALIFDRSDSSLAKEISDALEAHDVSSFPLHELKIGQHAGKSTSDIYEELFHRDLLFCIVIFTDAFIRHLSKDDTLRSALFEARRAKSEYLLPVHVSNTVSLPPTLADLKTFDLSTYGVAGLIQAIVSRLPAMAIAERPYALSPYPDIDAVILAGEPTRKITTVGKPIRQPNEGIGFEVFKAENPIRSRDHLFYLHLYRNASLEATCEAFTRFAREHSISPDKLVALLEKEPNVRRTEDRLHNVQAFLSLQPDDVYYIDEYLFKFSRELDQSTLRSKWPIPNYVPTHLTTQSEANVDALALLKRWSLAPNRPVLAIKAPGGIGKTTLIRHFANTIVDSGSARLVYAEAATIIDNLSKITNPPTISTLQDLFLLCTRQPAGTFYAQQSAGNVEDLVRINYDHGKLFFIVDGLDELISRLDVRFEVAQFLQSLHDSTKDSGLGKVLVTCRDYFWDVRSVAFDNLIESCELQAFDLSQAQKFFDNEFAPGKYTNHAQLRDRAMKEVAFIQGNTTSPTFLPYILEVVSKILKDPQAALFSQTPSAIASTATSLTRDITVDRVTTQLCQREVLRFQEAALPVQEQLLVLAALAAEETGPRHVAHVAHERTFGDVCAEAIGRRVPDRQLENLRGHILLESQGETARFRYDFFQEHFIQRYLRTFLTTDKLLGDREIRIVGTYFDFGSTFLRTFVEEMGRQLTSPDFEYRALALVEDLLSKQKPKQKSDQSVQDAFAYQRALAGILNLMLSSNLGSGGPTIDRATNIARTLFGRTEDGQVIINGLCVRNITTASGRPVVFNFEGNILQSCSFENYEYFWRCKFDNKTRFEKSRFIHVGRARRSEIKVTMANFGNDNILDEDAREALEDLQSTIGRTTTQISDGLVKFLSLFRSSSGTYTGNIKDIHLQRGHYAKLRIRLPYRRFLDIMERTQILRRYEHRGDDHVEIRPSAHAAVTLLVEQGLFEGSTASARQALERELLGV